MITSKTKNEESGILVDDPQFRVVIRRNPDICSDCKTEDIYLDAVLNITDLTMGGALLKAEKIASILQAVVCKIRRLDE